MRINTGASVTVRCSEVEGGSYRCEHVNEKGEEDCGKPATVEFSGWSEDSFYLLYTCDEHEQWAEKRTEGWDI